MSDEAPKAMIIDLFAALSEGLKPAPKKNRDDACASCSHVREAHFEQRDRDCNGQTWNSETESYDECRCSEFMEP